MKPLFNFLDPALTMSYITSLIPLHRSEPIHFHLPCYSSSHTCNSLPSSPCRHIDSHPTPSHHYNLPPPYHNYHLLSPPYYSHPHTPCHSPLHPSMLGVHASEKYSSSPCWWHSPTHDDSPCHCHSSPKTCSHYHPCVQTTAETPLEQVVKNQN